jgi:Tol biopolymer transport system component
MQRFHVSLFQGACFGFLALAPLSAQTTTRVSVATGGAQADAASTTFGDAPGQISADGRYVVFGSVATNLVAGDTNACSDVFVYDRQIGVTSRVSVATGGAQGDNTSRFPVISADGRFVAFSSTATNLVAGDTNGVEDAFVHDRATGTTVRVSIATDGTQGDGFSQASSLSSDGRYVGLFSAASNLAHGAPHTYGHAFVRDLLTGTTESVSFNTDGIEANANSSGPVVSGDGRYAVFSSNANNLIVGDINGTYDVFVRDRLMQTTTCVSVGTSSLTGNGASDTATISADGRFVAFRSHASNLVPGGSDGEFSVFVRDLQTGTTELASADSTGSEGTSGSTSPSLSSDGRYVAFVSHAPNLVPGDTNAADDVFVHDRQTGTTTRVSVEADGSQANSNAGSPTISADGRYIVFDDAATNLVAGDTNGVVDVFVRDTGPTFQSFCSGDGSIGSCPCANNGSSGRGCENSVSTGGALLQVSGATNPDSVVLSASGELATALTIFLQGDATIPAAHFGDGLRCTGGNLKRLFVKNAVAGQAFAPGAGDPSLSARSASLGDVIPAGASRDYQTYYRDANASFCPAPQGSTFNASNGIAIVW